MLSLRTLSVALLVAIATASHVPRAFGASPEASLTLAPHCVSAQRDACPRYEPENASTLKTPAVAVGDILDIDIVLASDTPERVGSVRAWLSFDPTILEARSVDLQSSVTEPTPGEQSIDAEKGIVKIGGGVQLPHGGKEFPLARVTFRVKAASSTSTIAFYDYQPSGFGHTSVMSTTSAKTGDGGIPCIEKLIGCRAAPEPLLVTEPATVRVVMNIPAAASPVAAIISPTMQTPSALASGASQYPVVPDEPHAAAPSTISLLEVQNVRVTTKGSDIAISWLGLKSAGLKGYNVYYGTTPGRYLQRRSVPAEASSTMIRDLEPGTVYYLAVRAFGVDNAESAFSSEVSVTVGSPETASHPMTAKDARIQNPGVNAVARLRGDALAGDTGTGRDVLVLLLIAGAIGTITAGVRSRRFASSHTA